MIVLLICWLIFTLSLMSKNEKVLDTRQIAISEGDIRCEKDSSDLLDVKLNFIKFRLIAYPIAELPINPRIKLMFKGAFLTDHYDETSDNYIYFYLSLEDSAENTRNISELLKFPIADQLQIDKVKEIKRSKTIYFDESDFKSIHQNQSILKVNILTELETSFSVNFSYDPSPLDKDLGLILATFVLLGLYILIIWELVHRTFAAIVASTLAIGNLYHLVSPMTNYCFHYFIKVSSRR